MGAISANGERQKKPNKYGPLSVSRGNFDYVSRCLLSPGMTQRRDSSAKMQINAMGNVKIIVFVSAAIPHSVVEEVLHESTLYICSVKLLMQSTLLFHISHAQAFI